MTVPKVATIGSPQDLTAGIARIVAEIKGPQKPQGFTVLPAIDTAKISDAERARIAAMIDDGGPSFGEILKAR